MKQITAKEILDKPFNYIGTYVKVEYKTPWVNKGNRMTQETAYFVGRIIFISTVIIQIEKDGFSIKVPLGYFISIVQAEDPPLTHILAKENIELKAKRMALKEFLEDK